jgi:O-acetyl-ADP-ribose deacetylase (regulator of RNase III)
MLEYISGNLLDSPAQTLVNTVNTVGVMGKGIALEFKHRYPEMFERYAAFCKADKFKIGMLYLYRTPNKWVLNFATKKHWRNPSKLEYIETGLKKFVETYAEHGIISIAFPQLGCGNGGLEWSVVKPVMESYLRPLPIPVYLYIRPQDDTFIPEHNQRIKPDNSPRRMLGFAEFLADVMKLSGKTQVPSPEELWYEVLQADHPSISLDINGRIRKIGGEDLEDLWNSLRLRGALDEGAFPSNLKTIAGEFMELLSRLDYVKPIIFTDAYGVTRPGIQFAPNANTGIQDSCSASLVNE